MRKFIFLIMLLIGISNNSFAEDKLVPFSIIYFHGDESINRSELSVFIIENNFYAKKILPKYYCGVASDSTWTVKLNKKQILACVKFLKIAKTFTSECPMENKVFLARKM